MPRPLLPKPDALVAVAHPPPPHDQLGRNNNPRSRRTEARRQESVAWLDKEWAGPGWLPPDVRAGLPSVGLQEPAAMVVDCLRKITELLKAKDVDVCSVWQPDGVLRTAVESDLEQRAITPRRGSSHLQPRLTSTTAKAVLSRLQTELQADEPSHVNSPDLSPELDTISVSSALYEDGFYDAHSDPSSPIPPAPAVTEHEMINKKRRHEELADPSETLRHNADVAIRRAEADHLAANVALARLRGRQETVDEGRAAMNTYIQDLRNDLDAHFGPTNGNANSDSAAGHGRRRTSMIVDSVKRDYYTRIDDAEAHCERVLISGSELPALIENAVRQEAMTKKKLLAAKARLTAIDHMWEAKKKRQEEARARDEYFQLETRMCDIQVQFDQAREVLAVKQREAVVSIEMAEQEDWAGILKDLGKSRE
ncbi:hypothetical protein FSARC_6917 [Fusarium sarcochroum]|uniref:Uncharacterized protein n=1 Tax=Fusarium sarcochroum TaxID=1208366 RepID=A0A8H4X7W5_9HYPO|nr:hypothetical protein FSARC_6917 [Fusarium sarcochroum]